MKKIILLKFFVGLFICFSFALPAYATARYAPGETLNPDCLPTDSTCTVSSVLTLGSNATFTNATSTGSFYSSFISALTGLFTNLVATNATTTNLTVANALTLSNLTNGILLAGTNGVISSSNATDTRSYLGLSYANSVDLINPGYQFAAWGDSLTQAYTPYLAPILGPVYNGGVGSEKSTQIKNRMLAATDKQGYVTIIWVGANNDMLTDVDTIKSDIASMVASLSTPQRYVVISTYISSNYASNTPEHVAMLLLNSYLADTYRDNYLDIRSYLVSQYNPLLSADVINHNDDVPPSSLRSDHIHLTPAGYLMVAQQIANFIRQKYYVSSNSVVRQSDLFNIFSAPYAIGSGTSSPGRFTNITLTGKGDYSAHLSSELVDSTGWTSSGWTGSYATGFIHTAGATTTLSRSVSANIVGASIVDKKYQVSFTISTSSAGSVNVSFGGVSSASFSYVASPQSFTFSPTASSTGDLIFSPSSDFNGTISSISVKEISASYPASFSILDAQGNSFLDIRGSGSNLLGNIFMGPDSGKYNVTGNGNTALGSNALVYNTSGNYNTAVGLNSLFQNTVGDSNTATGYSALSSNTTGVSNTANGTLALATNKTGSYNVGVGMNALLLNLTGNNNMAVGYDALKLNISGDNNTANGYKVLSSNSTGTQNTASGAYALNSNVSSYNTANGAFSLYFNTTGINNSAFGSNALYTNTMGHENSAIGMGALYYNTTGYSNSSVGYQSSYLNTTGNENTAIGKDALWQNTFGSSNTVGGVGASKYGLSATGTTAFGYYAGYGVSGNSSQYNALFGNYSGKSLSTGSWNTMVGAFAGYGLAVSDNNSIVDSYLTLIGTQASRDTNISSSVAITKSTAIGYNAKVGGSYMMALGGAGTSAVSVGIGTSTPNAYLNIFGSSSAQTLLRIATSTNQNILVMANTGNLGVGTATPAYKLQVYIDSTHEGHVDATGAWAQTSDENLKKNIITLPNALEDLMKLRGVRYDWRASENATGSVNIGFIAQEIEKVFPQFVDTGSNGVKGVAYGSFTPVLLQAIKEIQAEVLGFAQSITSAVGNFGKIKVEQGIEMKDETNGETYCLTISSGEWKKLKGECGQVVPLAPSSAGPVAPTNTVEILTSSSTPTEAVITEPVAPLIETPVAEDLPAETTSNE
jgi:hypothetical protein